MISLVKEYHLFDADYGDLLNMDDDNKTLIFKRQGLVFVFNFHVANSVPDYRFTVPEPGDYRIILNSDNPKYGGYNRVNDELTYTTSFQEDSQTHQLIIYNPNRTALVFGRFN
jgi:1,4-alpha-glucan branching enzyme